MTKVRVATWNLERPRSSTGVRQSRIQDWFRLIDADVWVLTETHQQLKPGPAYRGCWTGESDRQQDPGEVWAAIWSRFPMRALGPTRDPARSVAAMVDLPDGSALLVYGTVLPWLGSPWKHHPAAGGEAFQEALSAQHSDWVELIQHHPRTPLLVAGDLNQDLAKRHYYGSRANRAALRQALGNVGLSCLTAEENDPVARLTDGTRASIDHICIGQGLRRCNGDVSAAWPPQPAPDSGLSDHFGAVANIEPM